MPVPPPSFRRSLDEFVFINKNCLHRINAKRVLSIYSCCFASVGKHRIRKSSIVFQCNKVKRFLLLFSCLFFHSFSRQFKENNKITTKTIQQIQPLFSYSLFSVCSWRHTFMQIKCPSCWCSSRVWNFMQIYRHLYRTLFQILCFMDISGKKNPELQENILLRIPVLLT